MVWDLGVAQTQSPCEPKPLHVFRPRGPAAGAGGAVSGWTGAREGMAPPWKRQSQRNEAPSVHFVRPNGPLPFSTPGRPGKTSPPRLGNPLE